MTSRHHARSCGAPPRAPLSWKTPPFAGMFAYVTRPDEAELDYAEMLA